MPVNEMVQVVAPSNLEGGYLLDIMVNGETKTIVVVRCRLYGEGFVEIPRRRNQIDSILLVYVVSFAPALTIKQVITLTCMSLLVHAPSLSSS